MKTVALLIAVIPPGAAHAAVADTSRTRIDVPSLAGPGWFLCDGIDVPRVALVGRPGVGGALRIALVDKRLPGSAVAATGYVVGRADPGAGQVYYPLLRDGREAGHLHAFNPAALADPRAATTPPFSSIRLGGVDMQCRWLANTRFIGVAARRTIVVREGASGALTYESFDYAVRPPVRRFDGVQRTTEASQRVTGGQVATAGGTTRFRFDNAGHAYRITVPATGPAELAVARGDRMVQREALLAYTIAR